MGPLLLLLVGAQTRECHLPTIEHHILVISAWQLPEGWCPVLSGNHLHAGASATLADSRWHSMFLGQWICFWASGP